ncbi:DEAD/DEAH box helicase family protein [Lactobacillus sp. M0345]|nr:DEAD/DEAH box helicase family protein [Lactobacillus sp. M0345]
MVNKDDYSETDIRSKYIDPAIKKAGWREENIIREYEYTDGQISVVGKSIKRGKKKFVDILLNYPDNHPIALIEAKVHKFPASKGMQQGLDYANDLQVPFVFSSNGDSFVFHNRLADEDVEKEISMDEFPSPEALYNEYIQQTNANNNELELLNTKFHRSMGDKNPRYYQINAINNTVKAIAKGQKHIMFVMATGTGKTYTAFQIIWKLLKSKTVRKVLYLVDRNILADQPMQEDFQAFKNSAVKLNRKQWQDPTGLSAYSVYVGLYQQLFSGSNSDEKLYENFKPDFFDLIVIDEAHRGSANEESNWREILDYFAGEGSDTKVIGMTATPKETENANLGYFGEPVYEYSLRQGIQDGFLAPYKVIRVGLDKDILGYRPTKGKLDDNGELIEDREYNQKDFDRNIVLGKRTDAVAKFVSDFMKKNNQRLDKTIVFGEDIEHADRLRSAFIKENPDMVKKDNRYVMKITGDDEIGKNQLDNFEDNESKYPTIVTTSQLLRTGVNVKNVKLIVLDANINSMTEFKQIIGRGTRLNPKYGKYYFTIIDFRNVSRLFADPEFDGDPMEEVDTTENSIPDETSSNSEDSDSMDNLIDDTSNDDDEDSKRKKYYVNDVSVEVSNAKTFYYDENGKLVTENIVDFSKRNVLGKYPQLKDFLNAWKQSDKKAALIEEMEKHGLLLDEIRKEEDFSKFDDFDLIVHLAYDQPALTKQERINNVKKRGILFKYKDQARDVIQAILDKYQDPGIHIEDLESPQLLDTPNFKKFGGKIKIIRSFGGKKNYKEAIKELTDNLFVTEE